MTVPIFGTEDAASLLILAQTLDQALSRSVDFRVLEPTKDRVEGHRKQETTRWTASFDPLAMRNCPRVIPANSARVVLS